MHHSPTDQPSSRPGNKQDSVPATTTGKRVSDYSGTPSFRLNKRATISWLKRASSKAVADNPTASTWILDEVLEKDDSFPTWWTNPRDPPNGPLFVQPVTGKKPDWFNLARKDGFYNGINSWDSSSLSVLYPQKKFRVRYVLDRENKNRYLHTVLESTPVLEEEADGPSPSTAEAVKEATLEVKKALEAEKPHRVCKIEDDDEAHDD